MERIEKDEVCCNRNEERAVSGVRKGMKVFGEDLNT